MNPNGYSFRRFFQEVALLEQTFVVDEKGASAKASRKIWT